MIWMMEEKILNIKYADVLNTRRTENALEDRCRI